MPYVLAIDLGTSGPKTALVGSDGEIAAASSRPIATRLLPGGGAEQEPAQIWSSVLDAAAEVVLRARLPRDEIVGVATTSQFFSIVPVDSSGDAVMNLILWMDTRGAVFSRQIYERYADAVPVWIDVHGLIPLPSGNDSLAHMLFVQHEHPDVYRRTHKFLEAMDYLTLKLTGRCSANLCTAFPMLLTDNRQLDEPSWHTGLIERSGIDPEKLPELVPVGSRVGTLRPEVATRLGLSPDTAVLSGSNDTQAASIAAGTHRPGWGGINIGSTSQILAGSREKRTDLANDLLTMPCATGEGFTVMAENGVAGRALDHFARQVVFANDALGDHSSGELFPGLEDVLQATPVGSRDLLFLPWLTGTASPEANDTVRGAFLNLSLETGRAEMARAIVEGVTFSLRWLLGAVETFVAQRVEPLHFSGGAARSDGWSQIVSDIMGRPVRQFEDAHHTGCRAAAFLAFQELELAGKGDHARMFPVRHEYQPRPEHTATYDRLFEAFLQAFEQNKPVFAALNG